MQTCLSTLKDGVQHQRAVFISSHVAVDKNDSAVEGNVFQLNSSSFSLAIWEFWPQQSRCDIIRLRIGD
jgi:hypothetical protein